MKEINLSELILETKKAMGSFNLKESTLKNYYNPIFDEINKYYEKEKKEIFSVDVISQFMTITQQKYELNAITYSKYRNIRKVVSLLKEVYETGKLEWKYLSKFSIYDNVCSYFQSILTLYVEDKRNIGLYSDGTIKVYSSSISQFLKFIELKGHKDFSNLTAIDISIFITDISDRYHSSMKLLISAMRSFANFLKDNHLINFDMLLVLQIKPAKRKRIIPGFTQNEANVILKAVDLEKDYGKRDYAILLLARKTGLRSIDIVNLQFSNIDWRNNRISIIQKKTMNSLTLPLDIEVGNAIAEYILYSRPASKSKYIFLRAKAPYNKLSDNRSIYHIINKYMDKAEVSHKRGECKGFHSFRRLRGTSLLEAEVPLTTISQILGQRDLMSAKPYLSLNNEKLRACALEMNGIGIKNEVLL